MPYRICFEAEAKGLFEVFETIIDVTFILDICKRLIFLSSTDIFCDAQ